MVNSKQSETEDRRSRKTRHAIQTALLALMREKPLDRISVTELAERADINRKTFYNHYGTVQEVRQEMDQEYINMIFQLIHRPADTLGREDLREMVAGIVNAVVQDPVRSRLLLESGESEYLVQQLSDLIRPYLLRAASVSSVDAMVVAYTLEYLVHGIIAVLTTWGNGKWHAEPEQMKEILFNLVEGTVDRLSNTLQQLAEEDQIHRELPLLAELTLGAQQ